MNNPIVGPSIRKKLMKLVEYLNSDNYRNLRIYNEDDTIFVMRALVKTIDDNMNSLIINDEHAELIGDQIEEILCSLGLCYEIEIGLLDFIFNNTELDYLYTEVLDSRFSDGFNNSVNTTAIQSDGKVIVGGVFTSYNSVTVNRIVRLNQDLSIDNTFNIGSGFSSTVNSIEILDDEKILVGGAFTTYNGNTATKLIKLNVDGTIDTSFNPNAALVGTNATVLMTAEQTDGKVLVVGGRYTAYLNNYILRLNIDGTIDTTLNIGSGFNNIIRDVKVQTDGKILLCGQFTAFQGVNYGDVVRLNSDGTRDTSFTSLELGTIIYSIDLQSDGKIIVGSNNSTVRFINRLNNDGSLDTTFGGGGFRANSHVRYVKVLDDDKILIGGSLTTYNGVLVWRIARLNSDGTLDSNFQSGLSNGFGSGTVLHISIFSDDTILVGGSFSSYRGVISNNIIILNSDASIYNPNYIPLTFNSGVVNGSEIVKTVLTVNDNLFIFSSGGFRDSSYDKSYNNIDVGNLFAVDSETTSNVTYNNSVDTTYPVVSISKYLTNNIIIARSFEIASWNTTSFSIEDTYNIYANDVIKIGAFPSGEILILNYFGELNIINQEGILLFNNIVSFPYNFFIGDNNNYFVGSSDIYGYVDKYHKTIGKDNSFDSTYVTNNNLIGFSNNVLGVLVLFSQKILVYGSFYREEITDQDENINNLFYMVRLNSNGTEDNTFNYLNKFNGTVRCAVQQSNGKIILGGSFTEYDGNPCAHIVRLNSNMTFDNTFSYTDILEPINNGSFGDNGVYTMDLDQYNRLTIGGKFTEKQPTTNRIIKNIIRLQL